MTEQRPLPKHYLWYAVDVNRSAGFLLESTDGTLKSHSLAVSIGLSLHAIELCGKAMLRSLGYLSQEIREKHRTHNLLKLLAEVQQEISTHSDPKVQEFQDFLLHDPIVDGKRFGTPIALYLKQLDRLGENGKLRNYLYPDNEWFSSTRPISAVYKMAEYFIETAENFAAVMKFESS